MTGRYEFLTFDRPAGGRAWLTELLDVVQSAADVTSTMDGIAAFIICASLARQFEFAQHVWINDKTFHELGDEHDPICATQDGTLDFTVPQRPIRKVDKGIPAFTTLPGGAYFFLPGPTGLRYLATLGDGPQ